VSALIPRVPPDHVGATGRSPLPRTGRPAGVGAGFKPAPAQADGMAELET